MWERSHVERLTGLSRHMIQDLCYHNARGGGLGFWEPAVSKPGYSRFDEGDLLMFYLVGQLKHAGFTLKEVEAAVFAILEDGASLDRTLQEKACSLRQRQAVIAGHLEVLGCLEDAARARPADRLYAVMGLSLERSIARAVSDARAARSVGVEAAESVRDALLSVAQAMICRLWGIETPACDSIAHGMSGIDLDSSLDAVARRVGCCLQDDAPPTCRRARGIVHAVSLALAMPCAPRAGMPPRACERLVIEALARLLSDAGCGVPVELVFGNGSFAFLAQAFRACAGMA